MIAIGFIGASLFFGDGIITPAISVLSAVEGLSIATDVFDPFIMPIAITIIIALFLVQKHGTAFVGKFFWPDHDGVVLIVRIIRPSQCYSDSCGVGHV